jgi:hypothetical protein
VDLTVSGKGPREGFCNYDQEFSILNIKNKTWRTSLVGTMRAVTKRTLRRMGMKLGLRKQEMRTQFRRETSWKSTICNTALGMVE